MRQRPDLARSRDDVQQPPRRGRQRASRRRVGPARQVFDRRIGLEGPRHNRRRRADLSGRILSELPATTKSDAAAVGFSRLVADARFELFGHCEFFLSFIQLSLLLQDAPEVEVGRHMVGLEADRLAVRGDRLIQLILFLQSAAEAVVILGGVRLEPDCLAERGNRLVELVLLE